MFASRLLKHCDAFHDAAETLREKPQTLHVEEIFLSARVLYACAAAQELKSSLLFVVSDEEEKEKVLDDMKCFAPEWEEKSQSDSFRFSREPLFLPWKVKQTEPFFVASALSPLLQSLPQPDALYGSALHIRQGRSYGRNALFKSLAALDIERVPRIDAVNQFSVRGEVLEVFAPPYDAPVRCRFNDEQCESLCRIDLSGSEFQRMNEIIIFQNEPGGGALPVDFIPASFPCLVSLNEESALSQAAEALSMKESYEALRQKLGRFPCFSFSFAHHEGRIKKQAFTKSFPPEFFYGKISNFRREVRHLEKLGYRIFIFSKEARALAGAFLNENQTVLYDKTPDLKTKTPQSIEGNLSSGFKLPALKTAFFSDREIFTRVSGVSSREKSFAGKDDFNAGDFVVHIQFGVGKFLGLSALKRDGLSSEYALVQYGGEDRLYVPLDQMDRLQKYVCPDDKPPKILRLSTAAWEATKRKVKEKARDVAKDLLALYAAREEGSGFSHEPDSGMLAQVEDDFEFEETPGQSNAISDVKKDMESARSMDRLVCGDVGYGKTEVALRAAMKAVLSGKQVCLLAPTTVLAYQHFRVFKKRLKPFAVTLSLLTRFQEKKMQHRILEELRQGICDICIGTHRVIQKDVHFKDLGLVIVDEEQRFGVLQKEKLKNMRKAVDVLTLSATPIPRTLYMSLTGIRDISVIDTPPKERLAIQSRVAEADAEIVRNAIRFELDRGGQVFYVHNNIAELDAQVKTLKALVPSAKVVVAHGKLQGRLLERRMLDFINGKANVLVTTTVIENGLDIPNANTMVINNANHFGLAQLYQLRGRVGRSNRQAYAYFLYPRKALLSGIARERLSALQEFAELGSGYELAKRDLEIRGAGNVLGEEQSGFMAQVGFTLYCALLHQAVMELKGNPPAPEELCDIDFPYPAHIPASLVENDGKRLYYYRKLTCAQSCTEVDEIQEDIRNACGRVTEECTNLAEFVKIKILARECGVIQIKRNNENVAVKYRDENGRISALHKNFPTRDSNEYLEALKEIMRSMKSIHS